MRRLVLCVVLLAVSAGPLLAQADSGPTRGPRVRERIEHRFAERLRHELDLTDEQAARLREVAQENGRRRRELRLRERTLRAALEGQLREEAKADQDSVLRLTDDLLALRVEYAESWRQEMGDLDFLTPAQRARLMVLRERLLHRVHEMREARRGFRHRGDAH
jgi:Spy/CpxP family protein refolding chaperone